MDRWYSHCKVHVLEDEYHVVSFPTYQFPALFYSLGNLFCLFFLENQYRWLSSKPSSGTNSKSVFEEKFLSQSSESSGLLLLAFCISVFIDIFITMSVYLTYLYTVSYKINSTCYSFHGMAFVRFPPLSVMVLILDHLLQLGGPIFSVYALFSHPALFNFIGLSGLLTREALHQSGLVQRKVF